MWKLLVLPSANCKQSLLTPVSVVHTITPGCHLKTGGAPRNSIPGSDSQSTVAYLGPLYDKVVGVAIYSIHILYSTVNIIFGQN